jgi:glycosyltransferase involved in cell wall biosynthesis|tara:strand:+ start:827 stop:1912 length:1086 start_codon:yes stop_codon:yes gene_type:complete
MADIAVKAPLNSLSFGNVSYNLLRQAYLSKVSVSLFNLGQTPDLSAFNDIEEGFKEWIKEAFAERYNTISKDIPTLQLWHINGSENRITQSQTLLTFYELDSPTTTERNLVNLQNNVIFSSSYAKRNFQNAGCKNIHSVPMGFDEDFFETDKSYLPDKIHFGIIGKFEKRKHTAKILKAWASKYGDNYDYQLTCCITNPFYKPDQMNQAIAQALEGKQFGNISFLPFLKTNSEVNDLMNAIDIDLSGLSGGEGWNLPAFNCSALGKWSVVLNATSHMDWAKDSNCILVEPDDKIPAYDGIFFKEGNSFNQGSIYDVSTEKIIEGMERAERVCKTKNKDGVKLRDRFSYKKTFDKILKVMNF